MVEYSTLPDNQLLTLLHERDHAAFTEIYKRYWHILYIHSYRILQDEAAAQDIIQDLFTALWNNSDRVITGSLKSYLYSMARNQTLNVIHREKVKGRYLEFLTPFIDQHCSFTEEQVRFNELSALIEEGIRNLPPKMQEIFNMSRGEGATHRIIALQLDISENTVKSTINRALKMLRSKISCLFFF